MYTDVMLPYGDSFLPLTLPTRNIIHVITGKHVPGLDNEREAIQNALRNPIGCPSLQDCIHKNDKVLIITTDNTRPCPDDKIVPLLIDELEEKIPRKNITIIVALGLHEPLNKNELIKKLGRKILDNYKVINHNPNHTLSLGTTSFGTPIEVNSELTAADFRISTGFIEPHFFAGFSGGRKSITPGLCSTNTIRRNHSYEMIDHPNARAGILKGNPIHEDMVEQAKIAKLDFIVNVLLNKDRQITHVFAGNPWLAHEIGCVLEKDIVQVQINHKVDITIVTNGGAPLDQDFYQTCKGIDTASQITKSGGLIIMASSCANGIGPESFISLHASANSPREVLEIIKNGSHSGVTWQNQILARCQLDHSIFLLSNLDNDVASKMMATPIPTITQGLCNAFDILGENAEIAIIPEGPLVLPTVTTTSP